MKTFAIFGASGKTGAHLVTQALQKGHFIKAIVRNEEKLRTILAEEHHIKNHENLHVIKINNIFDENQLMGALKEVDVVLSALRFNRGSTGYSDMAKTIQRTLAKLEKVSPKCIFMHSWYTESSSRTNAPLTVLQYIEPILDEMRSAEIFLEEQNDFDYSVILPSGLSNGNATECDFLVAEDSWFIEDIGGFIARADVARYMIKTAEQDLHSRKVVAIAPM